MITCTSIGDQTLNFQWTLNNHPTFYKPGIVVRKLGKKSSVLTIDEVQTFHRGNITCKVQNPVGTDEKSWILKVNGDLKFHFNHNIFFIQKNNIITSSLIFRGALYTNRVDFG